MNDEILLEELFGSPQTSIDIALSYSRVSDFDRNGPQALIKRSELDSTAARIGSITDDLLNENENFKFENRYYKYEGNKPSATTGKVIDIITSNYNEIPDENTILEIIKVNDYWKGSSDETRLSKFKDNKEFYGYLEAFYESKDKIVITTNDLLLSKELANIIKTHNFTKDLFSDKYERYTQYKFVIEYKGIKFRGIIDFVLIDKVNKKVHIIDLKTGQENTLNFIKSFIKYRYYLQECIYSKAFNIICNELNLKGYTLEPFKFLYISRYEKIPLLWETTDKWHQSALNGFITSNGYNYNGLDSIIEDIKWHWDNKVFDLPRAVYESKGLLCLDDSFINIKQ